MAASQVKRHLVERVLVVVLSRMREIAPMAFYEDELLTDDILTMDLDEDEEELNDFSEDDDDSYGDDDDSDDSYGDDLSEDSEY